MLLVMEMVQSEDDNECQELVLRVALDELMPALD